MSWSCLATCRREAIPSPCLSSLTVLRYIIHRQSSPLFFNVIILVLICPLETQFCSPYREIWFLPRFLCYLFLPFIFLFSSVSFRPDLLLLFFFLFVFKLFYILIFLVFSDCFKAILCHENLSFHSYLLWSEFYKQLHF